MCFFCCCFFKKSNQEKQPPPLWFPIYVTLFLLDQSPCVLQAERGMWAPTGFGFRGRCRSKERCGGSPSPTPRGQE